MKLNHMARAALGLALLVSACAGGESAAEDTTTTLTRDLLAQPAGDGASTPIAANPATMDDGGPRIRVSEVGINRGSIDAPVKVVEMSDYGCGYCRQFHQESFPTILAQFIETGMVEWKFVPYITGMWGSSLPATEAAECVFAQDSGAFERLNGRLWDEQRVWKGADAPETLIRPWVSELGIDMDVFDACLASDERIRRIAEATTLAGQLAVRGTPTFIVLGYPPIQGALPLEAFQQILTMVHAEAVKGPEGGAPVGQ